jgi:tellurium resistance protein TerD
MVLELEKGQKINLEKEAPFAKKIRIGLGWDAQQYGGTAIDLDASAFLLATDGKVKQAKNFVYYHNKDSHCGSVIHNGDNLTGGTGTRNDDESMTIDLEQVPAGVSKILFTVTIYKAIERRQNFSQIKNAYIRCLDSDTARELARYEMSGANSSATCLVFGELVRAGTSWDFKALGILSQQDLGSFGRSLGLDV